MKPLRIVALVLMIFFLLAPLFMPERINDFLFWLSDILLYLLPDFVTNKLVALGYHIDIYWVFEKLSYFIPLSLNCLVIVLYYGKISIRYIKIVLISLLVLFVIFSLLFKLGEAFYVPYTFLHKIFALVSAPYAPMVLIPTINYLVKMNKTSRV